MIAQSKQHLRRARRRALRMRAGFTLIEIITVVVIITVLIAIALPALNAARKHAQVIQMTNNLMTIGTAIEVYHTDFKDYPRPDGPYVGFALLTKTMFSPGPNMGSSGFNGLPTLPEGSHPAGTVTSIGKPPSPQSPGTYTEYVAFGVPDPAGGFSATSGPPNNKQWSVFPVSDGKDGPGFVARPGGQPHNAYLQESKFRIRGMAILDFWDNPILYFPARPTKPTPAPIGSPNAGEWKLLPLTLAEGGDAFYNAFHNISFFMRPGQDDVTDVTAIANARKRMEAVLVVPGDNDFDGVMETTNGKNERAVTDKKFLLWSAGADGKFGPDFNTAASPTADDIRKVDDVTNIATGQ
jgi:prepilin-type N-terminal cleavage/methylation domain-containing protein